MGQGRPSKIMAQLPDLSLQPLVGYALWQLQHGYTISDTADLLAEHRIYSRFTQSERDVALTRAVTDYEASGFLHLATDEWTFGQMWLGALSDTDIIGIRYLLRIKQRDGTIREISVVVNTTAGSTLGDITTQVGLMVASGLLDQRNREAYNVVDILDIAPFQLVEGGYEGLTVVTI